MLHVYLPIAQMSVNSAAILGLGAAVGYLAGMFGIGGGFLVTPLLIFLGIPADIAVSSSADMLTATSVAGTVAQWRRGNIDMQMGLVLIAGGAAGSLAGVAVVRVLRQLGQFDLVVTIGYVTLLCLVGSLMLAESLRAMRRMRSGAPVRPRRRHTWVHGLPFKMRFKHSKLYVSVIPPILLGFVVAVLSAMMGVGGGFIMVPAMIYLLRMPTNVVMGTSLFQIMFVMAAVTFLHAVNNHSVDLVLALLLTLGGVIGVQWGVSMGRRLRAEHLRALLAVMVLAVAIRLLLGLVLVPGEAFNIAPSAEALP